MGRRWKVPFGGRSKILAALASVCVVVAVALLGAVGGLAWALAGLLVVQVGSTVLIAKFLLGLHRRLRRVEQAAGVPLGSARSSSGTEQRTDEASLTDLAQVRRDLNELRERSVDRLLQRARGARKEGHLDDALECCELALDWHPESSAARRLHQDILLDRAKQKGGIGRARRALDDQIRVGNHAHAARLVTALRLDGRDHLDLRDRAIALRDHAGDTDEAFRLARQAAQNHVEVLTSKRGEVPVARSQCSAERVFISGYFYSGSGAIKDYLRGFKETTIWPPTGELRIIKFPGGIADLAGRIRDNGSLGEQDLVDLYLHVTGLKVPASPLGTYDKWRMVNREGRRLHRATAPAAGYLAALYAGYLELVDAADRGTIELDWFEGFARELLAKALDAAAIDTGARVLVIDQAVTAWRLDIARFLPPSSLVIVHRDPRDQYSEVREVLSQPGRSSRSKRPKGFAKNYRRTRRLVDQTVPRIEAEHGHRVLRLSFDDFVLDHAAQAAVLHDFLGLDAADLVERRFKPEESRRNVGKYRYLLPTAAIETIENALPEYLHPQKPSS